MGDNISVEAVVRNLQACGHDAVRKDRSTCNIFSSFLSHAVEGETSPSNFLDFLHKYSLNLKG